MNKAPTKTGQRNRVSGIYHSGCHSGERQILEGQAFPRCAYCNAETTWVFIRAMKQSKSQKQPSNRA